jgi:hypothetical protein
MALLHGFVRRHGSPTGCSLASWIISSGRRAILYVGDTLPGTVSLQIINAAAARSHPQGGCAENQFALNL